MEHIKCVTNIWPVVIQNNVVVQVLLIFSMKWKNYKKNKNWVTTKILNLQPHHQPHEDNNTLATTEPLICLWKI